MKLTDILPHVTEIDPPWFFREYYKKYKVHEDDLEDIIPLYNIDYYDGPLSGMFKVHDNYFYGKAIYGEDRKWWACWELAEDELTRELAGHKLFQQYVGTHTDYYKDADDNWTRNIGTCKPRESCDIYYNMKDKPRVDYEEIESREIFGVLRNPFRNW